MLLLRTVSPAFVLTEPERGTKICIRDWIHANKTLQGNLYSNAKCVQAQALFWETPCYGNPTCLFATSAFQWSPLPVGFMAPMVFRSCFWSSFCRSLTKSKRRPLQNLSQHCKVLLFRWLLLYWKINEMLLKQRSWSSNPFSRGYCQLEAPALLCCVSHS